MKIRIDCPTERAICGNLLAPNSSMKTAATINKCHGLNSPIVASLVSAALTTLNILAPGGLGSARLGDLRDGAGMSLGTGVGARS